jgi:hypothetical protein
MLSRQKKVGATYLITGVVLLCVALFSGMERTSVIPLREVSTAIEPGFEHVTAEMIDPAYINVDAPHSLVEVPSLRISNTKKTTEASLAEVDRYVIPVYTYSTVLSAMELHQERSDFNFSGRMFFGLGFFVEAIGGKRPEKGKYWFLYVNGVKADQGASNQKVSPGDVVEWRYEIEE